MWGRAAASADLVQYRAKYPDKVDDATASRNVEFYRNQLPGPEGMLLNELYDKHGTDYKWLEYCHEFIQWLFPIQEPGLNPRAQVLMRHEIEIMRSDPEILQYIWRNFQMMLRFYGCSVEVHPSAPKNFQCARVSAVPYRPENVDDCAKGQSEEPGRPSATVLFTFRRDDEANPELHRRLYRNLCVSSHNYLRITRMLKFLGEMGMEDVKIGWLVFLAQEALSGTRPLKPCTTSLVNYWSGTIYDDRERAAFLSWMQSLVTAPIARPQKPSKSPPSLEEKKRDRTPSSDREDSNPTSPTLTSQEASAPPS